MTLGEAIQQAYCPPQPFRSERAGRTVVLHAPTRKAAGRVLRSLIEASPDAAKCVSMMREDARARAKDASAETAWQSVDLDERLRLQGKVQELDEELALRRARLCLRYQPEDDTISDEQIEFLLENEPDFADAVGKLCGHDDEDPTEENDDPFGSR